MFFPFLAPGERHIQPIPIQRDMDQGSGCQLHRLHTKGFREQPAGGVEQPVDHAETPGLRHVAD